MLQDYIAEASEDKWERLSCQVEEHMEKKSEVENGRPKRVTRRPVRYLD